VDKDLDKPSAASANDDEITRDCGSVLDVLVGKNEITALSPSYVEVVSSRMWTDLAPDQAVHLLRNLLGRAQPGDWDIFRDIIQKNPRAVVGLYYSDGSNALHAACSKNAPISAVQLLVQTHPDAVKEKDKDGYLPLHFACWTNQSLEVIQFLVQKHPNAIKEKSSNGDLPLHLVCGNNQSLEVIQFLVQKHIDAVKEKNIDGNLPLHLACGNNQSLEVIQCLVQQHPDTVNEKNSKGDLPLHFACSSKQPLEVIQWLVQQHPNLISARTHNWLAPCDLAKLTFAPGS
jgi:ankyrin repeat protein